VLVASGIARGDESRWLIEAAQPVHRRPRVRLFARRTLTARGWVLVALYGAYLATVGLELAR